MSEEMEMPCVCDCGRVFDLNDGNPCNDRADRKVYCDICVTEPWGKKKIKILKRSRKKE